MPVPTPSPSITAAVDQGLPKSVVDSFAIAGTIATTLGVLIALGVAVGGWIRDRSRQDRAQAMLISAHIHFVRLQFGMRRVVRLINNSPAPVYEVIVGTGFVSNLLPDFANGNDANVVVDVVPPGRYIVQNPPGLGTGRRVTDEDGEQLEDSPTDEERKNITLTFRDAAGTWWEKNARGQLKRLHQDGFRQRQMRTPYPWWTIENED